MPYSHVDVGWLKSVDEYYTGQGGRQSFELKLIALVSFIMTLGLMDFFLFFFLFANKGKKLKLFYENKSMNSVAMQ